MFFCLYGYKTDDKNCPICQCADKPICPSVLCHPDIKCAYGLYVDEKTGCGTCTCNACPLLTCSKICAYGMALDSTGCPYCACKNAAVCDASLGEVSIDSSNDPICTLKCAKYAVKNGCKVCSCAEPCTCGTAKSDPIKCGDGSISDYIPCDSTTNSCLQVRRECPIGIILTITSGTFTVADLDNFKQTLRIEDKDVSVTESTTTKGEYTIWVQKDSIPADQKDVDIAAAVQTSVKTSGKDGFANVIGSQTPKNSFGTTFVVSMASLLIVLFA